MIGLTYAATLTNYKKQFEIAAITYTIGYALYIVDLNEVVRLIVSIIAALIGGYGASVLWVSQGGYMVKLFKKHNIKDEDKGQYMGIMNGIVYGQVILGGSITTFALGLFGNFIYFIVLTTIGIGSLLFVHFLLDPLKE
jgi:MFS family permease